MNTSSESSGQVKKALMVVMALSVSGDDDILTHSIANLVNEHFKDVFQFFLNTIYYAKIAQASVTSHSVIPKKDIACLYYLLSFNIFLISIAIFSLLYFTIDRTTE